MKNIHILPTDKARLYIHQGKLYDHKKTMHITNGTQIPQNICITSNEKPKAGDWSIYQNKIHKCIEDIIGDEFKKIILTTDQELIKNGVQAISDEFLEWFVNNPSCEEVEVDRIELNTDYRSDWKQKFRHKIIIPKEKQKQQLIDMMRYDEELGLYDDSTRYAHNNFNMHETNNYQALKQGYEAGAIEMAKRRYSEEDIDKQIQDFKHDLLESTSDSIKQLCSGAILGLNRLKQFKKK